MAAASQTPDEIIKGHKRALTHAKGEKYADETEVEHDNGWFRVRHVDGTESKYRRRQMLFFAESLMETEFDADAYTKAVEDRQAAERQRIQQLEVQRKRASAAQPFNRPQPPTPIQNTSAGCFLSVLGLAISIGVIWWLASSWQGGNDRERVTPQPSVRVDAKTLFREYKDNEVSADLKYKNKYVVVTGTVRDVGKDVLDSIYVAIEAESWPFTVQCFFPDRAASSVAAIRKGQSVSIIGRVDGKFGNVMLKDCALQ